MENMRLQINRPAIFPDLSGRPRPQRFFGNLADTGSSGKNEEEKFTNIIRPPIEPRNNFLGIENIFRRIEEEKKSKPDNSKNEKMIVENCAICGNNIQEIEPTSKMTCCGQRAHLKCIFERNGKNCIFCSKKSEQNNVIEKPKN